MQIQQLFVFRAVLRHMDEVFTTGIMCSVYLQLRSPRFTTKNAKTLGNEEPEKSDAPTAATCRRRETLSRYAHTHSTGPSEHELLGLLLHSMGFQFECMCKREIKTHILHQRLELQKNVIYWMFWIKKYILILSRLYSTLETFPQQMEANIGLEF